MAGLRARAWVSLAVLTLVLGVVLFGFAGTLRYWHAWVYLLLFVGMSGAITLDLMRHDPALIVPALDFRFKWSRVPPAIVALGVVLFVLGFGFIARVYRENTFSSATIGVVEGQRVISTGPYAIVRHPMYASALVYLLGTPLALGSYWGLLALVFMAPFLLLRLVDEERMLVHDLPGYEAYRQRVRYRLVPFVW